ncbi:hypothetical protein D3C78_1764480 [compost metagenome]
MRMRLYARRDTEQNINLHAFVTCKRVQQLQLGEIINYEASNACIQRHVDLIRRFVVAVKVNSFHREACLKCRIQLAVRYDVQR